MNPLLTWALALLLACACRQVFEVGVELTEFAQSAQGLRVGQVWPHFDPEWWLCVAGHLHHTQGRGAHRHEACQGQGGGAGHLQYLTQLLTAHQAMCISKTADPPPLAS